MEIKIMKILMNKKTLLISILVFMTLTFLIPIQKPGFTQPQGYSTLFRFLSDYGEYTILAIVLILAIAVFMENRITRFFNKLLSIKLIYILSYIIMVSFMALWISRIPGLWWSWSTIGSFILMILVTPVILKDRVFVIDALLLGTGASSFIAGVWETIYKYGLWKYYEAQQGMPFHNYFVTIEFMLPFIVVGVMIIGLMILKNYEGLKTIFNFKLATLFLGITTVLLVIWFASGFWTDGYTNIITGAWIVTKPNTAAMDLYRATKATSNLSFLSLIGFWDLYLNKIKEDNNIENNT